MGDGTRQRLRRFLDVSWEGLKASERIVETGFNEARLRSSLAIVLILVGFLLVAQWRGAETRASALEAQSEQDLAMIIQELADGNRELRSEVVTLELRVAEYEAGERGRAEVLAKAQEDLTALAVMSGSVPVEGAGLVVRIEDEVNVLVAQDLVVLVHELRSAGAEAVAVGEMRYSPTSGFTDSPGGILMDGVPLPRDVEIRAIGHPQTLRQALEMPGGLSSVLSGFPGVTVTLSTASSITLPAADIRPFSLGTIVETP